MQYLVGSSSRGHWYNNPSAWSSGQALYEQAPPVHSMFSLFYSSLLRGWSGLVCSMYEFILSVAYVGITNKVCNPNSSIHLPPPPLYTWPCNSCQRCMGTIPFRSLTLFQTTVSSIHYPRGNRTPTSCMDVTLLCSFVFSIRDTSPVYYAMTHQRSRSPSSWECRGRKIGWSVCLCFCDGLGAAHRSGTSWLLSEAGLLLEHRSMGDT